MQQFCSGKAIKITHSESVFVDLGIQHAMRMRHIILSPVACPVVQYFLTLSHARYDFRKAVVERKMFVLVSSTIMPGTFLILRNDRDMITSVYRSTCEVPIIFVRF